MVSLTTLTSVIASLPVPSIAEPGAAGTPYLRNRVLVGMTPRARNAVEAAIEARGGYVASFYRPGSFFIVNAPSAAPTWAKLIEDSPGVRFAEPDYLVTADSTPDDPRYAAQWALPVIGAPEAWDVPAADDVLVGVVDSGIEYTHEDLASQMWVNPGEVAADGFDNDGNGWVDDVHGVDCLNEDGDPMDDYFHGTHMAGTIGATANNGIGIAGVARRVRLIALKFIGANGVGAISDAVQCLDYATQAGAAVTNNSWTYSGYSQALVEAIDRAGAAGQLFVTSAGNNGGDIDSVISRYPAALSLDNVVTVAATDQTDSLASFSNYGALSVDIAAPGVGILSTDIPGTYGTYSGTSMAANYVTGAAALLLAASPGTPYTELMDRLLGSATRIPSLQGKVASGRLDVARAIEDDVTAPGTITAAPAGATRGSLSIGWTAPAEDGPSSGTVSSYEIGYRPQGAASWRMATAPSPSAPGTSESAIVEGLTPGTAYEVLVTAIDNVGNRTSATLTASTKTGELYFEDDASQVAGWTSDPPWGLSSTNAHSAPTAWSDSPTGPYANAVDVSLTTASFSLSGAVAPMLTFWQRYRLQRTRDFGRVMISVDGGTTWSELAHYDGARDGHVATLDLSSFAGAAGVRLRFRLTTDLATVLDGWFIDDIVVSGADTTPPSAPTGLTAAPSSGQVALDWNDGDEPDLSSYTVYRTIDPPDTAERGWLPVASTASSVYVDPGLDDGTTYYYRVTSVDTSGNESKPSVEISATPYKPPTNYSPDSVTVIAGRSLGDPLDRLGASDDGYFRIAAAGKGANQQVIWIASAAVSAADASALVVSSEGSYSSPVAQKLLVYDWVTQGWVRIDATDVGTQDVAIEWKAPDVARFVSSNGVVRMRIEARAKSSFTAFTDLIRFRLEY